MQRAKTQSGILICLFFLAIGLMMARAASATGQRQEGYPPPSEAATEIPAIEPATNQPTALPYPPAGTDINQPAPVPIGSQAIEEAASGNSATDIPNAQQESSRGILFLWLGFLATILILLTSVVGAAILFTRRNES